MTEYFCQFCNYKTKIKTHFTKHLSTKKHKKNIGNEDEDFMNEKKFIIGPSKTLNFIENIKNDPKNSLKNPQFPSFFPQKPSKNEHNSCEFCGKKFSRPDNLKRHIETTCKKKE